MIDTDTMLCSDDTHAPGCPCRAGGDVEPRKLAMKRALDLPSAGSRLGFGDRIYVRRAGRTRLHLAVVLDKPTFLRSGTAVTVLVPFSFVKNDTRGAGQEELSRVRHVAQSGVDEIVEDVPTCGHPWPCTSRADGRCDHVDGNGTHQGYDYRCHLAPHDSTRHEHSKGSPIAGRPS